MAKPLLSTQLIGGILALAVATTGCASRQATQGSGGVPGRLDFPWDEATMTIYQRASKRLPGVDGHLHVQLGDITSGRVLVTVSGPGGVGVVDPTSLRQEDTLSIQLAEQRYVLRLDKLVNLLIGHDFGVFSLMPSEVWQAKNVVPARLDLPWDEARITIAQRASKRLPGEVGFLRVTLGDITRGCVLVTVSGPNGELVVDTTSLRQGDVLPLPLAERKYGLRLDELVNLPLGRDYAVFSLMQPYAWEAARINALLDAIAASDAVFLRNDEELSGSEFATHLRGKRRHYAQRNAPVDLFIEKTARRSVSTGEPYRMRLPSGETVDVATWLGEQQAGD